MKIRYESEAGNRGFLVLESSPQIRTIYINKHKPLTRVSFPYLIHIFEYSINTEREKPYCYEGLRGRGLSVYFTTATLSSFDDKVYISHTDAEYQGRSCTPHKYDFTEYKSVNDLVKKVLDVWWSSYHNVSQPDALLNCWQTIDPDTLKLKWGEKISLWDLIQLPFFGLPSFFKKGEAKPAMIDRDFR